MAEIDQDLDHDRADAGVIARFGAKAIAARDRNGTAPDGSVVDEDIRLAGWRAPLARNTGDETLLVTSNGAPASLSLQIPDWPARHNAPEPKLRTGGWGVLTRASDGAWSVIEIGAP